MDTILYFYRKRDLKEAWVEPVGLKSYMLIRVGLNVGEGEWFGIRPDPSFCLKASVNTGIKTEQELSEKAQIPHKARGFWQRILKVSVQTAKQPTGKQSGRQRSTVQEDLCRSKKPQGRGKILHRLGQDNVRFNEADERKRLQEERKRLQEERADRIRRIEEDMKALAAEILELAGEESRCYAVYDDSVRKAVLKKDEDGFHSMDAFRGGADEETVPEAVLAARKDSVLPSLWHRYIDFEEFSGYTEAFWTGLLMPQAVLFHFVILGTAPCVPGWIEKSAYRMKSLKWILPEEQSGPEILEFVEDFYTEYGLAISLQTLPGDRGYKGLRVLCSLPSNILDFTGDSCLNIPETARGSVWLDFLSVEEKRRRIEGRCPGVSYFSLREKWKRAQRRCKEPLLP